MMGYIGFALLVGISVGGLYLYYKVERLDREIARQRMADLAEGEGITFDVLEINMKKNDKLIELDEVIALGPSISVLMDGYHGPNVTSLRGTLIPAKTLNKMLSKIPLLGNIIIPKEIGEGLFGISFKMKGPPGKIKTTINPIRTITPRFIQKIIDRNKVIK